jgi:hypothetical protein
MKLVLLRSTSLCLPTKFQGTWPLAFLVLLRRLKSFWTSPWLWVFQKKLLLALLAADFQTHSSVELLRLCGQPAVAVSQYLAQVRNFETLLGLRTLCTAHVLDCTSKWIRTKTTLSELSETKLWTPCQRTPCGQFHCTPCRNSSIDRETIETHSPYSFSLGFHTFNKKSFIHSIKEVAWQKE